VHRELWWGNLRETDGLEGLRVVGSNVKMDPKHEYTVCKGVDWVHLAQDMDKWRATVKAAVKCRVS
jgi:hypothetical protein